MFIRVLAVASSAAAEKNLVLKVECVGEAGSKSPAFLFSLAEVINRTRLRHSNQRSRKSACESLDSFKDPKLFYL